MKEMIGGLLETEGKWIGGLAGVGAVLGLVYFFGQMLYLWYIFPNEFPWYGWLFLVLLGTVGGALVGALLGVGTYLVIVVGLGLFLAALIIGGVGLVVYMLLLLLGMV